MPHSWPNCPRTVVCVTAHTRAMIARVFWLGEPQMALKGNKITDKPIIIGEARVDVSLPWDQEWQKKSRDDVPTSKEPIPENPLKQLLQQRQQQSSNSQGDSKNPPKDTK